MNITELLTFTVQNNASDLHISAGMPPLLRVEGEMRRLNTEALDHKAAHALIYDILSDSQRKDFEEDLELDFSFAIKNVGRFRVNVFNQQRGIASVMRVIPTDIPTLEQLQAPDVFSRLTEAPRGLVLVTGPTGSGKSTTLAAMVDNINTNTGRHILTIEDPIEFVHQSKKSLVNQRELHRDTYSFSASLKAALREDPDVILVGEMRDLETIRLAMTAAETGHLVFGTLHTTSAAKTINRIIDVFPEGEKPMIRGMLSESLNAVVAQTLLKKQGGGRVAAHEIMICTSAIRNLIREDKVSQMFSAMQTSRGVGMQTLDQCLQELLQKGLIDKEAARSKAADPTLFQ